MIFLPFNFYNFDKMINIKKHGRNQKFQLIHVISLIKKGTIYFCSRISFLIASQSILQLEVPQVVQSPVHCLGFLRCVYIDLRTSPTIKTKTISTITSPIYDSPFFYIILQSAFLLDPKLLI